MKFRTGFSSFKLLESGMQLVSDKLFLEWLVIIRYLGELGSLERGGYCFNKFLMDFEFVLLWLTPSLIFIYKYN